MNKNSIFEDYQKALEGKPFPFEKYGLANKEPATDEEYQSLLKRLKELGLSEIEAIRLLAISFNDGDWIIS